MSIDSEAALSSQPHYLLQKILAELIVFCLFDQIGHSGRFNKISHTLVVQLNFNSPWVKTLNFVHFELSCLLQLFQFVLLLDQKT